MKNLKLKIFVLFLLIFISISLVNASPITISISSSLGNILNLGDATTISCTATSENESNLTVQSTNIIIDGNNFCSGINSCSGIYTMATISNKIVNCTTIYNGTGNTSSLESSILLKFNVSSIDFDLDNILDTIDNCINDYNPLQEDSDNDSIGDVCDSIIGDGQISSFTKNLIFSGAGNQTVYLKIPKTANVLTSSLNMSGSNGLNLILEDNFDDNDINWSIWAQQEYKSYCENPDIFTSCDTSITESSNSITIYSHLVRNNEYIDMGGIKLALLSNLNLKGGNLYKLITFDTYSNFPEGSPTLDFHEIQITDGTELGQYAGGVEQNTINLYSNSSIENEKSYAILINNLEETASLYINGNLYITKNIGSEINETCNAGGSGNLCIEPLNEWHIRIRLWDSRATQTYIISNFKIYNLIKPIININYPINPSLEVGNIDANPEWSYSGTFNTQETTQDLSNSINNYLSSCTPDVDGNCLVPLNFNSESSGVLKISNVTINYNLNNNSNVDENGCIYNPELTNPLGLTWDGTSFWYSDEADKRVYKISTDGSILGSFIGPEPPSPNIVEGMAWDGTYLWIVSYPSGNLYKINTVQALIDGNTNNAIVSTIGSFQSYTESMAYGNSALWTSFGSGNNKIYKIDSITGSKLGEFLSFPWLENRITGCSWKDSHLLCSFFNGATENYTSIKEIDTEKALSEGIIDNSIIAEYIPPRGEHAVGIAFVNSKIWYSNPANGRICPIDINPPPTTCSLDLNKWEERQDPEGQPLFLEHYVDTSLENYHTQDSTPENRVYLVPKYQFKTGDSLEYNVNFISGSGTYASMLLLTGSQYVRFGIAGPGAYGLVEPGIYNITVTFFSDHIEIKRLAPSGIYYNQDYPLSNSDGIYELYVGSYIGSSGDVHYDYDNFKINGIIYDNFNCNYCTIPIDSMIITEDTAFCTGTYNLPNGINIQANDITLDCDNSILIGIENQTNISTQINGINLVDINGVTIKNCNIYNYARGIQLWRSDNNIISNNHIEVETTGIELYQNSDNNIIENNYVSNSEQGIHIRGIGGTNSFNIIRNNEVFSNIYGIEDQESNGTEIYNNNAYNNDMNIFLAGTLNAIVYENNLTNGGLNGINILSSTNCSIWKNNLYIQGIEDNNEGNNIYCVDSIGNNYFDGAIGPICSINNDIDGDGVTNDIDNCINNYNPLQEDIDGDGIGDACDSIIGTPPENTTIIIDNSTNLTQQYSGNLQVILTQASKIVAEFNYNFSEAPLNITDLFVEKEPASATKAYIILRGLELPNGNTKTLYMNRLNTNLNYVCIKDAEINDISEITNNCHGENEFLVPCNGNEFSGYTCTKTDINYIITGLKHSSVIEYGAIAKLQLGVFYFGDIDGNGSITGSDLTKLNKYILKKLPIDFACSPLSLDVNGDGFVTGSDSTQINKYILKKSIDFSGKPTNIITNVLNSNFNGTFIIGINYNLEILVTDLDGTPRPCIGVDFNTTMGSLNKDYGLTDEDGKIYLTLTAENPGAGVLNSFIKGDNNKNIDNISIDYNNIVVE